jgi:hypothetical protein
MPRDAESPDVTRAPGTYTDRNPAVASKGKPTPAISDGYDPDYMTIGEEIHARRAYGIFADEVDDYRLARARAGGFGNRDRRAESREARRGMRVWGGDAA